MRDAAMHEHRRENRDPVPSGDDVRGNQRPLCDERLAAAELEKEDDHVHCDDQGRHDRHMDRASSGVAERNELHSGLLMRTTMPLCLWCAKNARGWISSEIMTSRFCPTPGQVAVPQLRRILPARVAKSPCRPHGSSARVATSRL